MMERIKTALRADGINTYEAAQKLGTVKAGYCVVRDIGVRQQPKSKGLLGWRTYEILCLVPTTAPEDMGPLTVQVRKALSSLPIRYEGEAETGVEEDYRALGKSLMYTQACRL